MKLPHPLQRLLVSLARDEGQGMVEYALFCNISGAIGQ